MNRELRLLILSRYDSQADFAQAVKCDEAIISRVLRGRRKLTAEQAETWAACLQCSIADLRTVSVCRS